MRVVVIMLKFKDFRFRMLTINIETTPFLLSAPASQVYFPSHIQHLLTD